MHCSLPQEEDHAPTTPCLPRRRSKRLNPEMASSNDASDEVSDLAVVMCSGKCPRCSEASFQYNQLLPLLMHDCPFKCNTQLENKLHPPAMKVGPHAHARTCTCTCTVVLSCCIENSTLSELLCCLHLRPEDDSFVNRWCMHTACLGFSLGCTLAHSMSSKQNSSSVTLLCHAQCNTAVTYPMQCSM